MSGDGEEARVSIRNESDVTVARRVARKIAATAGLSREAVEAFAIAVSEVSRNIVVHALSGEIVVHLTGGTLAGRRGVVAVASDRGPGIADIERALADGYSTVDGLGLGLPGAKRLVDDFEITTTVGQGTTVTLIKWAPDGRA